MQKRQSLAAQRPNALLDYVIAAKDLKNDAAFARLTLVAPPRVSKLRHNKLRVTGDLLLQIHDATGLPLTELRAVLAAEK